MKTATKLMMATAGIAAMLAGCQEKAQVPKDLDMPRTFQVHEFHINEDGSYLYDRSETLVNGMVHYFGGRSWENDGYKVQINDSAVQLPDGRMKIRLVSLEELSTGLYVQATDYGIDGDFDKVKVPSQDLFWSKEDPVDEKATALLETVKRETAKLDYVSPTIVRQLEQ